MSLLHKHGDVRWLQYQVSFCDVVMQFERVVLFLLRHLQARLCPACVVSGPLKDDMLSSD